MDRDASCLSSAYLQSSPLNILFLSHTLEDDYGFRLWQGMLDAAQKEGVNLLCANSLVSYGLRAYPTAVYKCLMTAELDGVILSAGPSVSSGDAPRMLLNFEHYQQLPMVCISSSIKGKTCISTENHAGIRAVMQHLIYVHGYRRLAFIKGPDGNADAEERFAAYVETLTLHGLSYDPELVVSGNFNHDGGEAGIHELLEQRRLQIDAVIAANDFAALGACKALQQRGLHVPTDVAVVGFDDIEESRIAFPALTTIKQPIYELGYQSLSMLLRQLKGEQLPQRIVLPTQLVIRHSCGCQAVYPTVKLSDYNNTNEVTPEKTSATLTEKLTAAFSHVKEITVRIPRLVNALIHDLSETSPSTFLMALEDILQPEIEQGLDISDWQYIIATLQLHLQPLLTDTAKRTRAEYLWPQAYFIIGEMLGRVEKIRQLQQDQQVRILRYLENRLTSNFDFHDIIAILAEHLPLFNIFGVYLSMYEDSTSGEWSRLFLAYDEQQRLSFPERGYRFLSCELIPKQMRPATPPYSLVLIPIVLQPSGKQIGFVIFRNVGITNRMLYNALSCALHSVLLVQQVQERSAELSREKFIVDSFMTNVPDLIAFKDCEGRLLRANEAYIKRLGLSHSHDVIGKTDFDFFPLEYAQVNHAQEQKILRTGVPVTFEERERFPDGTTEMLLTTTMPLRDEHDKIIGSVSISRMITELKQTQTALLQAYTEVEQRVQERTIELRELNDMLREESIKHQETATSLQVSELQYRMLADTVADGILIVRQRQTLFTNAAFASMVDSSPQELFNADVLDLFSEQRKKFAFEQLCQTEKTRSHFSWKEKMLTRTQRTFWGEIKQTPIEWNGKPASLLCIRDITERIEEQQRLEQENLSLKSTLSERYKFGHLIGKSQAMQHVYNLIANAAASDANVLIEGESGTGKELTARTIHQMSRRSAHAFVPVNCASIQESLFEREFFGHCKGAFTGADRNRPGFFDRAHQGTLFLDEVTELSPGNQAKLLRVLQDGEYMPLGSNVPKKADVLILAATHKACSLELKQGRLRQDFFYRLCVIEITLPPLRMRKEDLPLLLEDILLRYQRKHAQAHGTQSGHFPLNANMLPPELLNALYAHDWPGNVRELQNIMHRYLATNDLSLITISPQKSPNITITRSIGIGEKTLSEATHEFEKQLIEETLNQQAYQTGKAAKRLGITRRTLQRKIKEYQI